MGLFDKIKEFGARLFNKSVYKPMDFSNDQVKALQAYTKSEFNYKAEINAVTLNGNRQGLTYVNSKGETKILSVQNLTSTIKTENGYDMYEPEALYRVVEKNGQVTAKPIKNEKEFKTAVAEGSLLNMVHMYSQKRQYAKQIDIMSKGLIDADMRHYLYMRKDNDGKMLIDGKPVTVEKWQQQEIKKITDQYNTLYKAKESSIKTSVEKVDEFYGLIKQEKTKDENFKVLLNKLNDTKTDFKLGEKYASGLQDLRKFVDVPASTIAIFAVARELLVLKGDKNDENISLFATMDKNGNAKYISDNLELIKNSSYDKAKKEMLTEMYLDVVGYNLENGKLVELTDKVYNLSATELGQISDTYLKSRSKEFGEFNKTAEFSIDVLDILIKKREAQSEVESVKAQADAVLTKHADKSVHLEYRNNKLPGSQPLDQKSYPELFEYFDAAVLEADTLQLFDAKKPSDKMVKARHIEAVKTDLKDDISEILGMVSSLQGKRYDRSVNMTETSGLGHYTYTLDTEKQENIAPATIVLEGNRRDGYVAKILEPDADALYRKYSDDIELIADNIIAIAAAQEKIKTNVALNQHQLELIAFVRNAELVNDCTKQSIAALETLAVIKREFGEIKAVNVEDYSQKIEKNNITIEKSRLNRNAEINNNLENTKKTARFLLDNTTKQKNSICNDTINKAQQERDDKLIKAYYNNFITVLAEELVHESSLGAPLTPKQLQSKIDAQKLAVQQEFVKDFIESSNPDKVAIQLVNVANDILAKTGTRINRSSQMTKIHADSIFGYEIKPDGSYVDRTGYENSDGINKEFENKKSTAEALRDNEVKAAVEIHNQIVIQATTTRDRNLISAAAQFDTAKAIQEWDLNQQFKVKQVAAADSKIKRLEELKTKLSEFKNNNIEFSKIQDTLIAEVENVDTKFARKLLAKAQSGLSSLDESMKEIEFEQTRETEKLKSYLNVSDLKNAKTDENGVYIVPVEPISIITSQPTDAVVTEYVQNQLILDHLLNRKNYPEETEKDFAEFVELLIPEDLAQEYEKKFTNGTPEDKANFIKEISNDIRIVNETIYGSLRDGVANNQTDFLGYENSRQFITEDLVNNVVAIMISDKQDELDEELAKQKEAEAEKEQTPELRTEQDEEKQRRVEEVAREITDENKAIEEAKAEGKEPEKIKFMSAKGKYTKDGCENAAKALGKIIKKLHAENAKTAREEYYKAQAAQNAAPVAPAVEPQATVQPEAGQRNEAGQRLAESIAKIAAEKAAREAAERGNISEPVPVATEKKETKQEKLAKAIYLRQVSKASTKGTVFGNDEYAKMTPDEKTQYMKDLQELMAKKIEASGISGDVKNTILTKLSNMADKDGKIVGYEKLLASFHMAVQQCVSVAKGAKPGDARIREEKLEKLNEAMERGSVITELSVDQVQQFSVGDLVKFALGLGVLDKKSFDEGTKKVLEALDKAGIKAEDFTEETVDKIYKNLKENEKSKAGIAELSEDKLNEKVTGGKLPEKGVKPEANLDGDNQEVMFP